MPTVADRVLFALVLENAMLEKKGQEFEDFFVRAGTALWGQDFEPWRPQGRLGDMKCDGYRISERTVFQCHAPENFVAARVREKIQNDFAGAREYFGADMQNWVFVHNHKNGLPAEANKYLLDLRRAHEDITIVSWTPDDLISQILDLSDSELAKLFPTLVENQRFSAATMSLLEDIGRDKQAVALAVEVDEPVANVGVLEPALDKIDAEDRELRVRLLGYSRWYDPANKTEISEKLDKFGYGPEQIEINARRLEEAGLIKITTNYYLTADEEVCQEAAESLMTEFLDELGD
jgi:hypothetical protein